MFKRLLNKICGTWYYLKLRYQFKGSKADFDNFMQFMGTPYVAKMDFSEQEDKGTFLRKYLSNPIHRQRLSLAWQSQIEEFRNTPPFVLKDPSTKKSVRDTILEAIKEAGAA